jgi:hypothetical protein
MMNTRLALLRRILLAIFALLFVAASPAAAGEPAAQDPFTGAVYRMRDARSGRISSWDRTGGNKDFISFQPNETKELARLDGPGLITHTTSFSKPRAPGMWWGSTSPATISSAAGGARGTT